MIAYIAAPFKRKAEAKEFAAELQRLDVDTNARWLLSHPSTDDPAELAIQAQDDLEDIDNADIFVLLNFKGWLMEGQGGKHVETGYALAKGKPVFVVGKRWNVFHYLPQINVVNNAAAIAAAVYQRTGDEVI